MRAITSKPINYSAVMKLYSIVLLIVFVNALLRLKDGPSAKPIVDFLELERSKALFSHRTQTLVSGSGDDNDRIDIVLSRNSENQGKFYYFSCNSMN